MIFAADGGIVTGMQLWASSIVDLLRPAGD